MKIKFTRDYMGYFKGDVANVTEELAIGVINAHAGINAGDDAKLSVKPKDDSAALKKLQAKLDAANEKIAALTNELEAAKKKS